MSGRVNCLKKLTRSQYEMIKELSLIGAAIMLDSVGLDGEQQEALESLISMCGGAEIDINGECTFEFSFNQRYIEAYNEVVFWKGLADRLAVRDTLDYLGESINEDNIERYEKVKKDYVDKYLREFKKEGYSNKLLPY